MVDEQPLFLIFNLHVLIFTLEVEVEVHQVHAKDAEIKTKDAEYSESIFLQSVSSHRSFKAAVLPIHWSLIFNLYALIFNLEVEIAVAVVVHQVHPNPYFWPFKRTSMAVYLDFEKPIQELQEQLDNLVQVKEKSKLKSSDAIQELETKLDKTRKSIYKNLTPWQKVQVSRHPERPYTLAYIEALTGGDFIELHGDRGVRDDKAMVGGIGSIDGKSFMFVGQQKGVNTKMRQYRNFGMANPEGYRKALRLFKMAEKFNKPIVCFIDTPGAFPGLEAEERGQGEAIARNIYEMFNLRVPVIAIIIGEGASGGALGIGVADKVLMMEYTWYSVISPESCSSILWRSWDYKEQAADALKLTANNMLDNGLIDDIIKEPMGGAHNNPVEAFKNVKAEILAQYDSLKRIKPDARINARIEKYSGMGVFVEG